MSSSPQLAPPGSSSYDSHTMHVGDGTWDAGRDTFLLPNLVGLNFATMRYNGMSNRFFTMAGYHSLVQAHGIIAAVTFLGAVPLSILLMRFYGRRPRLALRMHIWLQILTLLLSTVVVILGFMAVGPNRSLTNPHHGIGVAIYVLVWIQIMGGCLMHRTEKNRRRLHIPLRAMLHHWLGRAIALLAIVQVALGLTVYGSPLYLFVLYTLYVFALVVVYFVLQYLAERRRARYGTDGGSYYSDEVVGRKDDHGRTGGLGKLAVAGAAGLGMAALFRRRSDRRPRPHVGTGSMATSDDTATSSMTDEKLAPARAGVGHRLLQVAGVGAALAAAKKMFGRGDGRDDDEDSGPYRPPLGGNQSVMTDSMSRIEEGRLARPSHADGSPGGYTRPSHPLAQPPMTPGSGRRHSTSSVSFTDSFLSGSPSRRDRRLHPLRNMMAASGAMFAVRQLFKGRSQRKEDQRAEDLRRQRLEQERISRMQSAHKYTGDGTRPPRRPGHHRMGSQTASDLSHDMASGLPGASGALPAASAGMAAAAALADRNRIRPVGADPTIMHPGPPTGMPVDVPPVPPPHLDHSSGSELYTTGSGRQRHRHHLRDEAMAGVAGAALGAAATDQAHRRHDGRNTDSIESPPVSLKVKMHDDGRRVTLRRLTAEEAAAQREARRRGRRAPAASRSRPSSLSGSDSEPLPAGAGSDARRWRRTEALEAQQAAENEAAGRLLHPVAAASAFPPQPPTSPPFAPGTQMADSRPGQTLPLPMPPPIPASAASYLGPGSVTSPGTETSGATEYANNRRRRRAERAQARLAREARQGNTVDFT